MSSLYPYVMPVMLTLACSGLNLKMTLTVHQPQLNRENVGTQVAANSVSRRNQRFKQRDAAPQASR